MRTIYFHLIGGAAGDMLLSSLIGLGCPLTYLKKEFKKINLDFKLDCVTIEKGHLSAKKIVFSGKVNLSYKEIINFIQHSKLDKDIKEKAIAAYRAIFNVEKKIHKIKKNDFYFHHLGEIDAILEICGFYLALKYLKIEKAYVSSFPLSLPAPATLELLKDKKISIVDFGYETVTPTAAILLKEYEQVSGPFVFNKFSIACGDCGDKDYLIAYFGDEGRGASGEGREIEQDKVIKIETNIDDMSPQIFESLFSVLYQAGAKEVYIEQVIMKKSRPAFILNVLCRHRDLEKIRNIIFSHTTTFGVRYCEYQRDKLKYNFVLKKTKLGKVKFRVSKSPFKKEIPEYEDCLTASKKLNIPLIEAIKLLGL
jgi:uncharacterized protein (TIGR00299 family) protein